MKQLKDNPLTRSHFAWALPTSEKRNRATVFLNDFRINWRGKNKAAFDGEIGTRIAQSSFCEFCRFTCYPGS